MNLSFIPDVIYQTKPCKGSNKAEGGDGFQKNLWASEKMRKEQDDTLLVSKPSWSITLLLAEAKMSHSGSLLYKHHCKWGVWKWELVGMHKGNRQSVWDFRPFIIYKMLVAGTANYSTSKESGGLVLLFSWEALCYAALFMCLQGRKLVDLIFCKRWNHYRLMKKWLRWIMAIGEVQEKKNHSKPLLQPHLPLEGAEPPADPMGIHTTGQGAGWDQTSGLCQSKTKREGERTCCSCLTAAGKFCLLPGKSLNPLSASHKEQ